ncbi:bifunctional DNA primase/polymerase [Streptomyces sp. ME01-18a]|uniref:bifunctional DNA primase/polymerase n=1 Tax=Streptomyces sp. ME01-18a TaxID=3028669 RepID=UPI0029B46A14|nr:bifunctional DNA primase/polymerase [Streptomyces sp. ME01-18a]MDX3433931.1 bifunctional DNA primase/polymerase [Streptomyces sp. ME01-18a]
MARNSETSVPRTAGHASPYDVARWCAANGWPVLPLAAGRKTPAGNCRTCRETTHRPQDCPCHPAGKWCHGFYAATTNPDLLHAWWRNNPTLGVGISCGPARLVVLDIDAHSAEVPARNRLLPGIPIHESVNLDGLASGFDTIALLAALRGEKSPADDDSTLRVRTPSGGLHVWYQIPDHGPQYKSSVGSSPKVALAWQVDIRATGGYIVTPATQTAVGSYQALGTARLPAPLPSWLANELQRTGHTVNSAPAPQPVPRPSRTIPTAERAYRFLAPLLTEVEACAVSPEGTAFTEKLNRAAYTAGGLVAAGYLERDQAHHLLIAVADAVRPHRHRHSSGVISSALSAGASRPLHLKGRP